jgi:HSP20 family protein
MGTDIVRLMQGLLAPGGPPLQSIGWRPAADVYRVRDGWLVKLDLAGVRPEDVRLSVCGRQLTVEGSRRDCQIEDGQQHYFMEIAYSHFERTIELPRELKQARISTEYRDGMLFVRLTEEAAS